MSDVSQPEAEPSNRGSPLVERSTLPRWARMRSARDYRAVFERAIRSRDAAFTMLARPNRRADARLGLAISKRSVPHATRRNRIKRQIRESFRRCRLELDGLDIVVMARPGVDRWEARRVRESLCRHWQRIDEKCSRPA